MHQWRASCARLQATHTLERSQVPRTCSQVSRTVFTSDARPGAGGPFTHAASRVVLTRRDGYTGLAAGVSGDGRHAKSAFCGSATGHYARLLIDPATVLPWGMSKALHDALRRMTRLSHSYPVDAVLGTVPDVERVVFNGTNNGVGLVYTLLAPGGVWQSPPPSGAKTLRIKSGGNTADTALGTGARRISLDGLDAAGQRISAELPTNGALASEATSQAFMRLNPARVIATGNRTAPTVGSHAGPIIIEAADGSGDWATIAAPPDVPAPSRGVSTPGVYSVPAGYNAFIVNIASSVQSNKTAQVLFVARGGILTETAPFSPWYQLFDAKGNTGTAEYPQEFPLGPVPGPCDIAVLGRFEAASGQIAVQLTLLLFPA